MTSRLTFDFSRPASLAYNLSGSAVFDQGAELGRASASVGSGDGIVRVAAAQKGSYANDLDLTLATRGVTRVEADGQHLRLLMTSGLTAAQAIAALNTRLRDPRRFYSRQRADSVTEASRALHGDVGVLPYMGFGADRSSGDGTDPATPGTAAFTGGADPDVFAGNTAQYNSDAAAAGLFVFDADEPLQLVQLAADLGASVAWALTLRRLTPAWGEQGSGMPIASGTAQSVLVTDRNVIIPPGWGIGFNAATTGFAMVTVRRA